MLSTLEETRRRKATSFLLLLDFEKAFDSVSHPCLLFKLHKVGIKGKLLILLKNFLGKRQVRLKINGKLGRPRRCGDTGVPQGAVLSPLLFIIYVSDLLSTKNLPEPVRQHTECFKFADDGSVLVTGEASQCQQIMEEVLNYIKDWCHKWRLMVNCEQNKTEVLVIQPRTRSTSAYTPVPLFLGNSEIRYAGKSKVLGVYIDTKLEFREHGRYVLGKCWHSWYILTGNSTRHEGAGGPALALLFRTVVLTKLLYAAPVWLKGQLSFFDNFMARARLKITGGQFHCSKVLSELLTMLAPLRVSLELLDVKFILTGLTAGDTMTAKLLQIESEPNHPFYKGIMSTKRYLRWKSDPLASSTPNGRQQTFLRDCSLVDVDLQTLHYTNDSMEEYGHMLWNDAVRNSITSITRTDPYTTIPVHSDEELQLLVDCGALFTVPLLRRSLSRRTTTAVVDFVHGHNLRFQDFLYAQQQIDRSVHCPECLECFKPDSPFHKLFECELGDGLVELREQLTPISRYEHHSHLALLFSRERKLQDLFCDLVDKVILLSSFGEELLT
eukprot:sb/3463582/